MESPFKIYSSSSSHHLPHQQFSSRIAFGSDLTDRPIVSNSIRFKSPSNRNTAKLPPIARCDTPTVPKASVKILRQRLDSIESIDLDSERILKNNLDPFLRIKQLEANLKFVREDCQQMITSLHQEIEDLKIQNRDLQFELIMKGSPISQQISDSLAKDNKNTIPLIRGPIDNVVKEHITKLENDVKRLRHALGETLKINAILRNQLQCLQNEDNNKPIVKEINANNNWLSSPNSLEFNKTFAEISQLKVTNDNIISLPQIKRNYLK